MKIKLHESKERHTIAKQSQLSSLNSSMIKIRKEDSKHAKLSTNITTQSFHLNATAKKSTKQKKSEQQNQQKKQKTIRNTQMVTSGRGKTLKQKVKNKKSCDFQIMSKNLINPMQQQGSVSYREYFLVENAFVPIVSRNEQEKIEQIMRSTADTTHRYEDFNRATFRNVFPFKLRGNNHKIEKSNEISRINESEENIFVKKEKRVSRREVEIEASPFYEQVGIQYSERPQFRKPIEQIIEVKEQQVKAVQIDIQTDIIQAENSPVKFLDEFIAEPQQPKQQSLSDLLIKLQFKHLPNQNAFENMSKPQKQHYSQLLNSLISKLNSSPRQKEQQITPIKTKEMIQIEEVQLMPLEQIKLKYQKLQMEIIKRESYQMNWIHKKFDPNPHEAAFDTSMVAVTSFLLNFFCYIELNFMDEFLESIKKQYGPSYFAQFRRITRNSEPPASIGSVLDSQIFEQFCQQLKQISAQEKAHCRCIFDYINNILDSYRPSYHHKGEPFPWALKMYNSICQYIIDESSMEIIFIQIKQNIQQTASMLCGLIVDEDLYKDISQINPLALKRNQKENLMMDCWLKQDTDESHLIECQATKVLAQLSDQVYNMLLLEMLTQFPLNKLT